MPKRATSATAARGKKAAGSASANGAVRGSRARGGKDLVIVESPAKARTIEGILGDRYRVIASVGHVRDLPTGRPGGDDYGVDVERRHLRADLRDAPRTRGTSSSRIKSAAGDCGARLSSPRTLTAKARPSRGTSWKPLTSPLEKTQSRRLPRDHEACD